MRDPWIFKTKKGQIITIIFFIYAFLSLIQCDKHSGQINTLIKDLNTDNTTKCHTAIIGLAKMGRIAKKSLKALNQLAIKQSKTDLGILSDATIYIIDPMGKLGPRSAFLMSIDPNIMTGLLMMAKMDDPQLKAVALKTLGLNIWAQFSIISRSDNLFKFKIKKDEKVEETIDILSKELENKNVDVRRSAAISIALISMHRKKIPTIRRSIGALKNVLQDSDIIIRNCAKLLLGDKSLKGKEKDQIIEYLDSQIQTFFKY